MAPRKTTTPYHVHDFPKKPKNLKKPTKKVRWAMDQPTRQERIDLYKKCPTCILVPPTSTQDKTDPMNYKFPICTKLDKTKGQCQFNCNGVVAANRRARLTKKYPKVVNLTKKLIAEWGCTKKAVEEKKKKAQAAVRKPVRKVTPSPLKKKKKKKKSVPRTTPRKTKKTKTTTARRQTKSLQKKKRTTTTRSLKK